MPILKRTACLLLLGLLPLAVPGLASAAFKRDGWYPEVLAGAPAKVVRKFVDGEGWVPPLRQETDVPDWWVVN